MDAQLSPCCVSIDLEVSKKSNQIFKFGAVRADTNKRLIYSDGNLKPALARLDAFTDGAEFVLGHNLIEFDLPHLKSVRPNLRLLKLPVIDTLRLSPLAFPRNPYHNLVKHYQDGGIKRGQLNDPELDARLALEVFSDECGALGKTDPDLLTTWHWLCTPDSTGVDRALDELFCRIRQAPRPTRSEANEAIYKRLFESACKTASRETIAKADQLSWALAYALAWLSVAEGNSVMPPWVRHQFPQAGQLVRDLRDKACTDKSCAWCRERHDAIKELKRWFNFIGFRSKPETDDGKSMQQAIIEEIMAGRHALGILPTGTGKSICYQIPALSRYSKTGALTVVISPLVALMADQVTGLEKRGIVCCLTVNGLLSMPERKEALERIRLGDAGIVLISPEQLRSRALRRVLEQREIGNWVLDEAHCLSRWGHDFRPDYRYISRFIKKLAGKGPIPSVLCLTATAKPAVIEDIVGHFQERLGIDLAVFNGGSERTNLTFEVMPTSESEKKANIFGVLRSHMPSDDSGGAIVYCATRKQSEDVAEYLKLKGISADRFHAGLQPETKKDVQKRFIDGELRVIAATNAFGMGIDKPNVRLVIHADIPGSLENYLQEAGRAGRDQDIARCVLLYDEGDIERQFGMSARSRLSNREINALLRALRNLDRKKRFEGKVVATVGEIVGADEDHEFERDSTTDDTRVRTAVSWLEESRFLTREENFVQVFPSSLRVSSVDEVKRKLAKSTLTVDYQRQLLSIVEVLMNADSDEGISTDELMTASGLSPEGVRGSLYDLERLGVASNDTALTAFVHTGIHHSSQRRLEEATALETALIAHMREEAPDQDKGDTSVLHLRMAAQFLRDQGLVDPLPERLWRIIRGISYDGQGENDNSVSSISVRKRDSETVQITLQREWQNLEETAKIRRKAAEVLLNHLLGCLPAGSRGTDLLAETTFGNLLYAMKADLDLMSAVRNVNNTDKLLDRALLWLHDQEVLRLNKGLAVFRPAMTIHLGQSRKNKFTKVDFQPLELHYKGQVLQIHVMAEYAKRGLDSVREAINLATDYFLMKEEEFLARWLPGKDKEIGRQTTPKSWRTIVEDLNNSFQQQIVADDREQTNVLVLAGPGSGKTRVLVHRIAYLIRVKRENARTILALAYNRHAALDIRRRLTELIGNDARGVTVLTCHALAMRLAGFSFKSVSERPDEDMFDHIIRIAVSVLNGDELLPEEADERRERLLAGFRWILVDEYQDIEAGQYELISALAGRSLNDEASKLTLFAVGDDDQNIYSFRGASVEYIRRFESDYGPKPSWLIANYRSTRNIVDAANAVIEKAKNRMKVKHPIRVNPERYKDPPGGKWTDLDPVARGRVQVLSAGSDPLYQARAVMAEFLRLKELAPDWDWSNCAVIARDWKYLVPFRAFCEAYDIPVQFAYEEIPSFWRLRETQVLVDWLRKQKTKLIKSAELVEWAEALPSNPWCDLLQQAILEFEEEFGSEETHLDNCIEWLVEWGRNVRRRQHGLLLLTAHRAKGLEFDHVAVLDGGWGRCNKDEDPDAQRRLYYVAMTRAQHTLTLARFDDSKGFQNELRDNPAAFVRSKVDLPPCSQEVEYYCVQTTPKDVDLGFAGRYSSRNSIHKSIRELSVGDALEVRVVKEGCWTLRTTSGKIVGRFAKSFEPPSQMRCRSAEVFAIIRRSREDSDPGFRDNIKCDSWEVVMPALVFEPNR